LQFYIAQSYSYLWAGVAGAFFINGGTHRFLGIAWFSNGRTRFYLKSGVVASSRK
jgi:hypothetical protein